MKTYIALLRGINVSGKNKILMRDLKLLFQDLGFESIQTYIQSGNVIFKTTTKDQKELAQTIVGEIKEQFNYDIPVIVKNAVEIQEIVTVNPFLKETNFDSKKLYVSFLWNKPLDTSKLKNFNFGDDKYQIIGDIIYLYYNVGASKTKLTNVIIEKKLNTISTTRNWRTTNKLIEISLL